MVELYFPDIRLEVISSYNSDFSSSDYLSYNEEEGTVTFRYNTFKVNEPEKVYWYFRNLGIRAEQKKIWVVYMRITPKGKVLYKEYTYSNKFEKKLHMAGLMYDTSKPYQYLNYSPGQWEDEEEELRYT